MIRYLVPVVDQGVVAAFNLALQLSLIRVADPADYGAFVLWQSVVMVMFAFQDAMVGMPLSVRIAYNPANRRRMVVERQVLGFAALCIAACALGLFCAALIVAARGAAMTPGEALARAAAVALYGAAFLLYSAIRSLAQSRAMFSAALLVDATFTVLSLGALGFVYLAAGALPLTPVFLALSLPCVAAAALAAARLRPPARLSPRRSLVAYAPIWRDSRWTVAAVAAAELQNRAFIFILAGLYGAAVMGSIFAGLLVLRHVVVLSQAWVAFARPFLTKMRERAADAAMIAFVAASAAILAGLYLVNLAALTLVWPLVEQYIYTANYEDMWPVVALWTVVYVCGVPVITLAAFLVTLGRFRDDGVAVMAGSAVTVAAVFALGVGVGAREAVAGMAFGYGLTATLMALKIRAALAARGNVSLSRLRLGGSGS